MYIGSVGYIISLSLIAISFLLSWEGLALPILLFVFIASHAIGQGAVIWVFISEIYPNHLRTAGQSFGTSTHWVLAAIIPSLVPVLFASIGAGVVFAIFAFMMVLQLLFVYFWMPETKGVSLESLSQKLIKEKGRAILLSASAYEFYDWYPKITQMGRTTFDITAQANGGAYFDTKPKAHVNVMDIAEQNNQYVVCYVL